LGPGSQRFARLWYGAPVLLAILLAALPVTGSATCPSAGEVQVQLQGLLPEGTGRAGDEAEVQPAAAGVRVALRAASGAAVGERVLSEPGSCAELAREAAVILAAWEAETPSAAHQGELEGMRMAPPPEPWEFELALGGVASWSDAVAPGGWASVAVGPPGRWSGVVSFLGTGSRDVALGPGQVAWRRWEMGAGPRVRLSRAPELVLQAEAVAAGLSLRGQGFDSDGTALQLEPGARLSARAAWRWGPAALWLQLSLGGWLSSQRADVSGAQATTVQLPRVEALAAVGMAYARP
jgi:hypothetical protein